MMSKEDFISLVISEGASRPAFVIRSLVDGMSPQECIARTMLYAAQHPSEPASRFAFALLRDWEFDVYTSGNVTAVLAAAECGDAVALALLIRARLSIESRDAEGITPLGVAAARGHVDCVRLLIRARANVEHRDPDGRTPLWLAVAAGQLDTVKALVDAGADILAVAVTAAAPALPVSGSAEPGAAAASSRSPAAASTGFSAGGPLTTNTNASNAPSGSALVAAGTASEGKSALAVAVEHTSNVEHAPAITVTYVEIVRALLATRARYALQIDKRNARGETVLHLAVTRAPVAVVEMLLTAKASVECPTQHAETPLLLSAKRNRLDVLKLLLRCGAHVNAEDRARGTALFYASQLGFTQVVEALCQAGANLEFRGSGGRTALYCAATNGKADVVRILVAAGMDLTRFAMFYQILTTHHSAYFM